MAQRFQLSEAELWTRKRAVPTRRQHRGQAPSPFRAARCLAIRGPGLDQQPASAPPPWRRRERQALQTAQCVDATWAGAEEDVFFAGGGAAGVWAVLPPGVMVEQRSWNSALALVS